MKMLRSLAAAAMTLIASAALAHEADQYLVRLCAPSIENCDQQRADFRRLVASAYKNNLSAQRAVAQMLWKGSPVVLARWQAGCAWHMTITALGPKGLNESDFVNMRKNCSLLRPDEIELARNDARRIGQRILAGGKIDETVHEMKPDPKLDSTAYPLE